MNTYALRHRLCFLGILFFLVIMLPALALGAEESVRIKVIKDESLKSFCLKHLEDPNLWPEIGRYNHLADFDLIRAGSYLMVPLKLQKGKPVQGRVTFVKGEVFIRRNAGSGKKPLQIQDRIFTGDIITTGPQSAVEVDFENRSTFYASPHTQVKVAVSEAKGVKYLVQRFVLITGNIVTKVRSATGSASRTVIQTPHATSAVRGTHFRVAVLKEQSTTTEVLQGTVDVTAKGVKVALQEGQGTKVKKGHAPIAPVTLLEPPPWATHRGSLARCRLRLHSRRFQAPDTIAFNSQEIATARTWFMMRSLNQAPAFNLIPLKTAFITCKAAVSIRSAWKDPSAIPVNLRSGQSPPRPLSSNQATARSTGTKK